GSNEMAGPESRKDQRVPLAAKVQIKTEGLEKFIEKFSGNISLGGIFIKTPQPLPVGKEVVITVVLPGGDKLIEARGTVTWTRPAHDPHSGEPAGMGIRFNKLAEGSEKTLEAVVEAGGEDVRDPSQPPEERPPEAPKPPKAAAKQEAKPEARPQPQPRKEEKPAAKPI